MRQLRTVEDIMVTGDFTPPRTKYAKVLLVRPKSKQVWLVVKVGSKLLRKTQTKWSETAEWPWPPRQRLELQICIILQIKEQEKEKYKKQGYQRSVYDPSELFII